MTSVAAALACRNVSREDASILVVDEKGIAPAQEVEDHLARRLQPVASNLVSIVNINEMALRKGPFVTPAGCG